MDTNLSHVGLRGAAMREGGKGEWRVKIQVFS